MADQTPILKTLSALDRFEVDAATVRLLDERFCRRHHVALLGKLTPQRGKPATVAMLNPADGELVAALERLLERPVSAVKLSVHEVHRVLDLGFEAAASPPARLALRPVARLELGGERSPEASLRATLGFALSLGASAIHFESLADGARVRARVDGVLQTLTADLGRWSLPGVIAQLEALAGLDRAAAGATRSGVVRALYETPDGARALNLELSISPGAHGDDATLRAPSPAPLGFDQLGLDEARRGALAALLGGPEGLLIIAGPAGSGRGTTLRAALGRIDATRRKVMMVDDAVEAALDGVNPRLPTGAEGFAERVRACLRHDPDVIAAGGVPDAATAAALIHARQTGRLVLTTLHASDAVNAIEHLEHLGVPAPQLASSLLSVLAQRLVRRVCTRCAAPVEPDAHARHVFAHVGVTPRLLQGRGCEACRGTGYRGRVGLFELISFDPRLAHALASSSDRLALRVAARERGARTLFEDALVKVAAGLTTLDEVTRAIPPTLWTAPPSERAREALALALEEASRVTAETSIEVEHEVVNAVRAATTPLPDAPSSLPPGAEVVLDFDSDFDPDPVVELDLDDDPEPTSGKASSALGPPEDPSNTLEAALAATLGATRLAVTAPKLSPTLDDAFEIDFESDDLLE